jgi:hypothetical protein
VSFDLGVWHEPEPISAGHAGRTYELLCRGDTSTVEDHPAVTRFYHDVVARFPTTATFDDAADREERWVWSMDPTESDSHVILAVSWSRAEEVYEFVSGRANELGLVCYDPQAGEVELPSS